MPLFQILYFQHIYVLTEQEKSEKQEELENLKLLLKFHSENRVIKQDRKFMEYVDKILDEINIIENELTNGK